MTYQAATASVASPAVGARMHAAQMSSGRILPLIHRPSEKHGQELIDFSFGSTQTQADNRSCWGTQAKTEGASCDCV